MKRSALFRSLLLSLAFLAIQNANAGSAVACDGHGHLVYSYGHLKEIDERQALELARSRYGASVRILAASEVTGYGAIAVARKGNNWIAGVTLGKRSATEADALAIDHCLKAGGIEPRVKWRFRG
jgi:hypothetical protein